MSVRRDTVCKPSRGALSDPSGYWTDIDQYSLVADFIECGSITRMLKSFADTTYKSRYLFFIPSIYHSQF